MLSYVMYVINKHEKSFILHAKNVPAKILFYKKFLSFNQTFSFMQYDTHIKI